MSSQIATSTDEVQLQDQLEWRIVRFENLVLVIKIDVSTIPNNILE